MGSSTKTTSDQTSKNTVDPGQFQQYQDNYNTAKANASSLTPYQGQLTAGFNPTQTQAQGILSGIATDPSYAAANNNAIGTVQGAVDSLSPANYGATIAQYENPYTSDVINASITQNERARQMAQVGDSQQATAAGAFGGSRSGVAAALTNGEYDRNNQSNIAGLNAANYAQAQNTASGNANQIMQGGGILSSLNANKLGLATQQAGILSAVGDAQQAQQQNELSNAYQAYMTGQQLTVQQQQLLNQALGMIPVQQTTNTTGNTTQTTSPGVAGILGGLGSLASGVTGLVGGGGGLTNALSGLTGTNAAGYGGLFGNATPTLAGYNSLSTVPLPSIRGF